MKTILTALLSLIISCAFAQKDYNGNPVFNSISTNQETIGDFQLLSNYYTLTNNIDNKKSSVYISKKPSLDEIENAAKNLPSDFFVITKRQGVINMIMILNNSSRQFFVINPATGKQKLFPCPIVGDISENRANEIIKANYDKKANLIDDKLFFNGRELTVISNNEIKKNILRLIETEQLSIGDSSGMKILSKEDLRILVLNESKEGGKLDFFTEIKGHEMDGIQIKPGLFSTRIGLALYKWGRGNFELGVNTLDDALAIWREFKGREANQREKDYIKLGFNEELEK